MHSDFRNEIYKCKKVPDGYLIDSTLKNKILIILKRSYDKASTENSDDVISVRSNCVELISIINNLKPDNNSNYLFDYHMFYIFNDIYCRYSYLMYDLEWTTVIDFVSNEMSGSELAEGRLSENKAKNYLFNKYKSIIKHKNNILIRDLKYEKRSF